ncbi:unnamed protein product, partial [Discosporangium mesarthrocarpum]
MDGRLFGPDHSSQVFSLDTCLDRLPAELLERIVAGNGDARIALPSAKINSTSLSPDTKGACERIASPIEARITLTSPAPMPHTSPTLDTKSEATVPGHLSQTPGSMIAAFLKKGSIPASLGSASVAPETAETSSTRSMRVPPAVPVQGGDQSEVSMAVPRGSRSAKERAIAETPVWSGPLTSAPAVLMSLRMDPSTKAVHGRGRTRPRVDGKDPFCNSAWPSVLKKRRRAIRYPGHSGPVGVKIIYWVSGTLRTRDNLALGVCIWLSRKLRMPLQAIVFVDPKVSRAVGRIQDGPCATVGPNIDATCEKNSPGGEGSERTEGGKESIWSAGGSGLSPSLAAEVSAQCEMEQSLQKLNIPLFAIPCATCNIPSTLALWCNPTGRGGGVGLEEAGEEPEVAEGQWSGMGRAHIVVTDESYHPRQLRLLEKTGEGLGATALYSVDSSSCCPIGTFCRM